MRNLKHLDISNHKIWEDKNIKPKAEGKNTKSNRGSKQDLFLVLSHFFNISIHIDFAVPVLSFLQPEHIMSKNNYFYMNSNSVHYTRFRSSTERFLNKNRAPVR